MTRTSTSGFVRQVGGAFVWGLFIIRAPIILVFLTALIWVPIFVWREKIRTRHYGFLPGAVYRYALIVLIVVLAAFAPVKFEDKKVGPLKNANPSLGELVEAKAIYSPRYKEHEEMRITLPSLFPRNRDIMTAITQQTGFKADVFHCGDVANILFGSGGGRISVWDSTNSCTQ